MIVSSLFLTHSARLEDQSVSGREGTPDHISLEGGTGSGER